MVLAVARTPEQRLRAAIKKQEAGEQERDEAIVDMRDAGAKLVEIAAVAKMSVEGVRKVLHRKGRR